MALKKRLSFLCQTTSCTIYDEKVIYLLLLLPLFSEPVNTKVQTRTRATTTTTVCIRRTGFGSNAKCVYAHTNLSCKLATDRQTYVGQTKNGSSKPLCLSVWQFLLLLFKHLISSLSPSLKTIALWRVIYTHSIDERS